MDLVKNGRGERGRLRQNNFIAKEKRGVCWGAYVADEVGSRDESSFECEWI